MSLSLNYFRKLIVLAPLCLAACGDGWEMQLTNTMFPYGNQRTAGSGVAYVRAQMMPEKELKLEPQAKTVVPAPEAGEEIKPVERDWKPEVMDMLPPADRKFDESLKK